MGKFGLEKLDEYESSIIVSLLTILILKASGMTLYIMLVITILISLDFIRRNKWKFEILLIPVGISMTLSFAFNFFIKYA